MNEPIVTGWVFAVRGLRVDSWNAIEESGKRWCGWLRWLRRRSWRITRRPSSSSPGTLGPFIDVLPPKHGPWHKNVKFCHSVTCSSSASLDKSMITSCSGFTLISLMVASSFPSSTCLVGGVASAWRGGSTKLSWPFVIRRSTSCTLATGSFWRDM